MKKDGEATERERERRRGGSNEEERMEKKRKENWSGRVKATRG